MQKTKLSAFAAQNSHFDNDQRRITPLLSQLPFVMVLLICTAGRGDVSMEKVGEPLWEIAGPTIRMQPGASDVGGDINGFRRNIRERQSEILGEEHVLAKNPLRHQTLPGEAHDGPYDREWREALAAAGEINTDAFLWSDARVPHGILFGYTLVPSEGAPMGASPDFSYGPIIPNGVLPIKEERYRRVRNGTLEVARDLTVPAALESLDKVGEITDENGVVRDYTGLNYSHASRETAFIWTSNKSKSRIVGAWEYTIEMRDANGDGWDVTYAYNAVPKLTDLLGDFSYNDRLDIRDLDILTQNIAVGATNLELDVNGDDDVNTDDVRFWVTELKSTLMGDANLDNSVDFKDFLVLSENFGGHGGWSQGDFDTNDIVDFADFLTLSDNFNRSAAGAAAAPEPSSLLLLMLGLFGTRYAQRKR